ncbi:hypothetical protein HDU96_004243, partial [Phlyctochytrium bullatum]
MPADHHRHLPRDDPSPPNNDDGDSMSDDDDEYHSDFDPTKNEDMDPSSSSRKRLRTMRACDPCRKKRIKCTGGSPCASCKLNPEQCGY